MEQLILRKADKLSKFYVSSRQLGVDVRESVKIYDQWAKVYDEECPLVGYHGPQYVAMATADYYPLEMRREIRILDVAAGTGLVGKELAKMGFSSIDALEPSEGMLKNLRKLSAYQKIYQDAIGLQVVNAIETNTYDCITISGGLGTGHIPVQGLNELIRMVKPGGTIFIAIMEDHLTSTHACNGLLEPYMEELESKLCWAKVRRTIVDNYTWKEPGVIFGFEVTTNVV